MTTTVPVGLDDRAYEVLVAHDALEQAGARIAPLLKRPRLTIVADETAHVLHGERLRASLEAANLAVTFVSVPPGEGSKSFAELERLLDRLLGLELDRGDTVAAFGGGVIGDLAGFAAAIYKRGVDFVQIPTTLLAQVDSSVGGKTAIDTARGKNLVGAFWQPRLVLADLAVLGTLPERQLRSGYAEIVKYGLIDDADLFGWLEANGARVLALDPAALEHAVVRSVERKAAIVSEDERDSGRRNLLNLGHTFAHAFEAELGFDEAALSHGEAVALGCALAFRLSARLELCTPDEAAQAAAVLAAAGLPTHMTALPRPLSAEALLARMGQDKKAENGALTLILARGVGRAFVARDVDASAVRDFLISEGAVP
ncbi:MAG TPA: 3-dehydroquinate synthase [Caulobacteraceae bacterium]|jgi:3-dehydroquinate synthase